jgi:5-methyltetrahydrofolate--homocysteine methyltransferase
VRISLAELLASRPVVLADGATGTNYFAMGLEPGAAPESWNDEHPDRVRALHERFVAAGADVVLTNTFGANRYRLALHGDAERAFELSQRAAQLAREVADRAERAVVVAGSVGPTGELFAPLGSLTEQDAVAAFREQLDGLAAGGADVAWIETMSAREELRAAARAAIDAGLPYTATCSFDTAGRTMMGLAPGELGAVFDGLAEPPVAIGANCGVGASDILVSLLEMAVTAETGGNVLISKGNCGIPRFEGAEVVYSGTPALMARYASLAIDAGARIVGGCCGTTPDHLAAMRAAVDGHERGAPPTFEAIVEHIGPLAAPPVRAPVGERPARRRARMR